MNKKIYCDIKRCLGCGACEIACAVEHSKSKKLSKAIEESPLPIKRREAQFVSTGVAISTSCHHCEEAFCVVACMSGAMHKDKTTGQTKYDEDKCVGCWMCLMSCPFGALERKEEEKKIIKCDFCPDRDIPICVEACPTGALFLGTLKEFEVMFKAKP